MIPVPHSGFGVKSSGEPVGCLFHPHRYTSPTTSKNLVLDLDATLVATQECMEDIFKLNIMKSPDYLEVRTRTYHIHIDDLEGRGVGTSYDYWGVARPGVYEFLDFATEYFQRIIIWSAGERRYVEAIVDYLFKDFPPPCIILTQENIRFDKNGDVLKPLSEIFRNYKGIEASNTFILDDNADTFALNRENGVLIPAFSPECSTHGLLQSDNNLEKFMNWLKTDDVIKSQDIRILNKDLIFI